MSLPGQQSFRPLTYFERWLTSQRFAAGRFHRFAEPFQFFGRVTSDPELRAVEIG
ncbi:MAG TPA: hypothetical protein VKI17_09585 [Gemmataceae bacterium]|nr:hypothetical protein [Gemmataceae bacterium]